MGKVSGFLQIDVFGREPYKGNPLAVILDGRGLEDEHMQEIAAWTNLSETTFILPPMHHDADYMVRIFNPVTELPFAGHPTLGTAHAWLEQGGRPKHDGFVVQECAAGLVKVNSGAGYLAFAAPQLVREGPVEADYLKQIADAYGIEESVIISHQWVDNGPGWAVVQLDSAADVLALEPDFSRIPDAMVGAVGFYPEGSEFAYELRTFAPAANVPEDPVCGSMNASVAQWLIGTGKVPSRYLVSQGQRIQRNGLIEITSDDDGTVWVGGPTHTCIRGEVTV